MGFAHEYFAYYAMKWSLLVVLSFFFHLCIDAHQFGMWVLCMLQPSDALLLLSSGRMLLRSDDVH
jgi:hypothetical protein